MKTVFCPLCKSIMKEGICTNRNCGNSKLEIDFNNFISKFNKLSDGKLKGINNSYLLGKDLFSESLTYDKQPRCYTLGELKELIERNIDINVKVSNFLIDEKRNENLDIYSTFKLIYFPLDKAKPIPKRIFRHYIELGLCTSKGFGKGATTVNRGIVFGSNDLEKWEPAGFNIHEDLKHNKEWYSTLLALASFSLGKSVLWTVSITDNKSGISIKTFFEKEKAYKLFKDREKKEGKKRRTALKHIVNEYQRESPKKSIVDEHFRGDMIFEWRGLTFKLTPPILDEKRINRKVEE